MVRSSSLTVGSFFAYGNLLGLFLTVKFGLVSPCLRGKSVRSFLLAVPLVRKLDLVFFYS